MGVCKNCGFSVDDDAQYCNICGVAITEKENSRVCGVCGVDIDGDYVFCPSCGSAFTERASARKESVKKYNEWERWAIWCTALGWICFFLAQVIAWAIIFAIDIIAHYGLPMRDALTYGFIPAEILVMLAVAFSIKSIIYASKNGTGKKRSIFCLFICAVIAVISITVEIMIVCDSAILRF